LYRPLRTSKPELNTDLRCLRPKFVDDGDNFRLRLGAGEGDVGSPVNGGLRVRVLFAGAGIGDSFAFGVWIELSGGAGLSSVVALALDCSDRARASLRVRAFVTVFVSCTSSDLAA